MLHIMMTGLVGRARCLVHEQDVRCIFPHVAKVMPKSCSSTAEMELIICDLASMAER